MPLRKILNERRNSQVWEVEEVNATSYILHTGMKIGLSFSFILSLQVFVLQFLSLNHQAALQLSIKQHGVLNQRDLVTHHVQLKIIGQT